LFFNHRESPPLNKQVKIVPIITPIQRLENTSNPVMLNNAIITADCEGSLTRYEVEK